MGDEGVIRKGQIWQIAFLTIIYWLNDKNQHNAISRATLVIELSSQYKVEEPFVQQNDHFDDKGVMKKRCTM